VVDRLATLDVIGFNPLGACWELSPGSRQLRWPDVLVRLLGLVQPCDEELVAVRGNAWPEDGRTTRVDVSGRKVRSGDQTGTPTAGRAKEDLASPDSSAANATEMEIKSENTMPPSNVPGETRRIASRCITDLVSVAGDFRAVVGGFLRNRDVMRMTLSYTRG